MPELPEVELVARTLRSLILNKTIHNAKILEPKLVPFSTTEIASKQLSRATIKQIHRRGKHLLFDFSNNLTLITHLRMTGSFSFYDKTQKLSRHTRAVLLFSDKTRLHFEDQRKFALMKIVSTGNLFTERELCELAPEPFSAEFNVEYLRRVLSRSRRNIKEFLLDQTKVCGLGNIYASEALFRAHIHPRVCALEISKPKTALLFGKIRDVLSEAIKKSSRKKVNPSKIDGNYFGGSNSGQWFVYDREGKSCAYCSKPIRRIVQGSRSTFYCPKCQRA